MSGYAGWRELKPSDLARLELKAKPAHKYHAQRTVIDGISFMSKAEANRYSDLRVLEKAGHICDLMRQPRWKLHLNGQELGTVIFDFKYRNVGSDAWVIEDVKGYEDAQKPATLYSRWKRRHFEIEYGLTVTLIKK